MSNIFDSFVTVFCVFSDVIMANPQEFDYSSDSSDQSSTSHECICSRLPVPNKEQQNLRKIEPSELSKMRQLKFRCDDIEADSDTETREENVYKSLGEYTKQDQKPLRQIPREEIKKSRYLKIYNNLESPNTSESDAMYIKSTSNKEKQNFRKLGPEEIKKGRYMKVRYKQIRAKKRKSNRSPYIAPPIPKAEKPKESESHFDMRPYISFNEIMEMRSVDMKKQAVLAFTEKKAKRIKTEKTKKTKEQKKHKLSVPAWYRNLSEKQMEAADSFHRVLQTNFGDFTIRLCLYLLNQLGIKPSPSKDNITTVLGISGGSDIAFLYFLKDLFYTEICNDCHHKVHGYNVNEQILMSAICHLDMIPILRELDTILPICTREEYLKNRNLKQTPLAVKSKTDLKHKAKMKKLRKQVKAKKINGKYVSPYLESLERPKPDGSNSYGPPKMPPIDFRPYDKWNNPDYVVPNETTRWFGVKKSNIYPPGVDMSRAPEPEETDESRKQAKSFLNELLDEIFENNYVEDDTEKSLCLKHKIIEEIRKKLAETIQDAATMQYMDYMMGRKEELEFRKMIRKKMEHDQKEALAAMERFPAGECSEEYCEEESEKTDNTSLECALATASKILTIQNPDGLPETTNRPAVNIFMQKLGSLIKERREDLKQCDKKLSPSPSAIFETHRKTYILNIDHGGSYDHKYFSVAQGITPYKFDYCKIYENSSICPPDMVRTAFGNVLNKRGLFKNIDDAIDDMIKKMWRQAIIDEENRDRKQDSCTQLHCCNPRDAKAMEFLLDKAFCQLRENPKYVLPQFPNAHRVPIFIEWLKCRFYFEYTTKERAESLRKSEQLFKNMMKEVPKLYIPLGKQVSNRSTLSYADKKSLFKKIKDAKDTAAHEVKATILHDSRNIWSPLAPYEVPSGYPRRLVFAYMPDSEPSAWLIKPWKSHEIGSGKKEFDRKVNEKMREEARIKKILYPKKKEKGSSSDINDVE